MDYEHSNTIQIWRLVHITQKYNVKDAVRECKMGHCCAWEESWDFRMVIERKICA